MPTVNGEPSLSLTALCAPTKLASAPAQTREGIRNAVLAGVQFIEHAVYVDESICAEMKARGTFAVSMLVASLGVVRKAEQ